MIDYNYYTNLPDKDLEKIVSHIKNIQNKRFENFQTLFMASDIENIQPLLQDINQDKLYKVFEKFSQDFNGSEKSIEFYIFLKQHNSTKDFNFSSIEQKICWNYANPKILELIKEKLPESFQNFKNHSFSLNSKSLISYLHKHDMIDFKSVFNSKNPTEAMIDYLLDNNMVDGFENFPFISWFPKMSEHSLKKVRAYFQLDLLDYKKLYNECDEFAMRSYMKDTFKFKTPDFLEHFIIDEFFVRDCSFTIDKVADNNKPLDFILKLYSLIQREDPFVQSHLIEVLKSEIKKPKNKTMLEKIELNFNLNQDLPSKNIKSSFNKI